MYLGPGVPVCVGSSWLPVFIQGPPLPAAPISPRRSPTHIHHPVMRPPPRKHHAHPSIPLARRPRTPGIEGTRAPSKRAALFPSPLGRARYFRSARHGHRMHGHTLWTRRHGRAAVSCKRHAACGPGGQAHRANSLPTLGFPHRRGRARSVWPTAQPIRRIKRRWPGRPRLTDSVEAGQTPRRPSARLGKGIILPTRRVMSVAS